MKRCISKSASTVPSIGRTTRLMRILISWEREAKNSHRSNSKRLLSWSREDMLRRNMLLNGFCSLSVTQSRRSLRLHRLIQSLLNLTHKCNRLNLAWSSWSLNSFQKVNPATNFSSSNVAANQSQFYRTSWIWFASATLPSFSRQHKLSTWSVPKATWCNRRWSSWWRGWISAPSRRARSSTTTDLNEFLLIKH